jgi:tripartite-type tricarboxylate transporter receptor subunit TctC
MSTIAGTLPSWGGRMPMMLAAVLALGAATAPAQAQLSLRGKTVTIYVAGGVGGGIDLYARAIAPYFGKYLPGEPSVVAANMPGAGGIQGVSYLYNVAPKDGTAMGTTNAGPVAEPLVGNAPVNYDLRKMRWIGSLLKGDTVCSVWYQSGIKTLDDAKKRDVPLTSTGVTSAPTRSALLMNALLGTRFKPIAGYDGGSSLLAIERGESAGICNTLSSLRTTRPNWIRDKQIIPLVQVALESDPDYRDVPRAIDLITNDEHRQMLEFYLAPYEFNNPYYLPPGVSDEVLGAYRRAFETAIRDPGYIADLDRLRQKLTPRDGADVANLVEKMFATPKSIIQKTIAATSPQPP